MLGIISVLVLVVLAVGAVRLLKQAEQKKVTPEITNTSPKPTPEAKQEMVSYGMTEVSKHNTETDCWLVIQGKVYDVTKFIPDHPGGVEILRGCGKDATSLFQGEREHAEGNVATTYLPTYLIGTVSR